MGEKYYYAILEQIMKDVLVDNWFMESVLTDIHDDAINTSQSISDLFMAIILWDNTFYPKNDYNWWTSVPSVVQNKLTPVDDITELDFNKIIDHLQMTDYSLKDEYLSWIKWNYSNHDIMNVVEKGAIKYMILSNRNGYDYLPCSRRREYIANVFRDNIIHQRISYRIQSQKYLDSSIKEYYKNAYSFLDEIKDYVYTTPVLDRYIFENAPDNMSAIDYAYHLKYEGHVIRYREHLTKLEDAFEKQNFREVKKLITGMKDVVNDVLSLDKKRIVFTEFQFLPTPSISLGYKGIELSLSESSSIRFNLDINKIAKKFHYSFLRELSNFATKKLPIKPNYKTIEPK